MVAAHYSHPCSHIEPQVNHGSGQVRGHSSAPVDESAPGKRCPTCTKEVWVLPGKNCGYCNTYVA